MKEIRCTNGRCRRLFFKAVFQGTIEIKCPKCGKVHTIKH
ncbi:Com family DNA-binding transcriptional regulator [Cytobacillus oceanisediminis]